MPENLTLTSAAEKEEAQKPLELHIPDEGINLNAELEKIEKRAIEEALIKTKGSKTKAAELLRVTFDSLRYRIEKLGIE